MPFGNGDISLNVWTEEETGSVCFYIGKTDAWDETGRLLKIGKVRVKIDPNPFAEGPHVQPEAQLRRGGGRGQGGGGRGGDPHPGLGGRQSARRPRRGLDASGERRDGIDRALASRAGGLKDALVSGLNYYPGIFGPTVVGPDVVVDEPAARIVWYHRQSRDPLFRQEPGHAGTRRRRPQGPAQGQSFWRAYGGRGLCQKRGQDARLRRKAPPARSPFTS